LPAAGPPAVNVDAVPGVAKPTGFAIVRAVPSDINVVPSPNTNIPRAAVIASAAVVAVAAADNVTCVPESTLKM
jgi:hypothetical protein